MTADDASQDADSPSDETRSVAFATKGEWLVLATDEQLIARTLELMSAADAAGNDSLAAQSWYADALARAPVQAGKLRMAIDLSRVIRSPHFRTYWIQQNITELSHYRAALCDLYQDASGFREERILLPATHDEDSKAASLQNADLSSLTVLVPPGSAVYRAVAHPSEQDVLATLNDKLLRRSAWGAADSNAAPHAILSTPQAGRDSDLETRIDEPDTAPTGAQNAEQTLQTLLNTLQVNAMLTLETHAATIQTSSTWIPFHAAIVLELGQPPDPKAVQSALSEAIRPDLTAGALGTAWTPVAGGFLITSDAHPLVLAVDGKRVLIANDPDLLKAILSRRQIHPDAHAIPALLMTGFDASGTRPFFLRWTAIVDGLDKAPSTNQPSPDDGNPPFLGKNIASLSNAFRQYSAEKFTARQDGEIVRQTVDYVF
jgi:hypothetical protein